MTSLPTQRSSGHRARKRFGQNFLVSEQVISGILAAVGATQNDHIVEIGPGLGALTKSLLATGAQVSAIELDRDLADYLQNQFQHLNQFSLINADALNVELSDLLPDPQPAGNLKVLGNLPYNISTPILFHLLKSLAYIKDMHFMLQKEVVERIAAQPGTSNWGRLSIMIQYHCRVEPLLDVPPDSFDPAPRVNSAVVRLTPRVPDTVVDDVEQLEKVVRIAFNMRRKTLRNTLKGLFNEQELVALDIDPSLRPEKLSLADYVRLANHSNV